ncbi:hypothetical protein NDU88_003547 [Pleurodeles waltl]|uniref:Uncharacterized protein n=1 Tax=Pleurodeles waltl TaxID=8319 RepID=A0AAV7VDL6_PLEWA|nr:hypothetical protein NDU88_003547 [Pleurodeles waltl]
MVLCRCHGHRAMEQDHRECGMREGRQLAEEDMLGHVDGLVPLSRASCNGTGPSGMWNAGGTAVSRGRLVREEWEKELLRIYLEIKDLPHFHDSDLSVL